MQAIHVTLIIEIFILLYKLNEIQLCLAHLKSSDVSLSQCSNTTNKLAIVLPVFFRKMNTEEGGTQSKEVMKILCCFVSSVNFISWVSRRAMKA